MTHQYIKNVNMGPTCLNEERDQIFYRVTLDFYVKEEWQELPYTPNPAKQQEAIRLIGNQFAEELSKLYADRVQQGLQVIKPEADYTSAASSCVAEQ